MTSGEKDFAQRDIDGIKTLKTLLCAYLCALFFPGAYTLVSSYESNGAYHSQALKDPLPPLGLRLVDETLLMVIFGLLLTLGLWRRPVGHNQFHWLLLVYLVVPLLLAAKMLLMGSASVSHVMALKNLVYPIAFGGLLIAVHAQGLTLYFLRRLNLIMLLSLLFGVGHYLYVPYQIFGDRLLGTQLNPNITAVVSFFSLVLSFCLYQGAHYKRWQFLAASVTATLSLCMSASLSANLAAVGWLVAMPFFVFLQKFKSAGKISLPWMRGYLSGYHMLWAAFAASFVLTGLLNPALVRSDYVEKYRNIAAYIMEHGQSGDEEIARKFGVNSVQGRVNYYKSAVSTSTLENAILGMRRDSYELGDSSLINLYVNSGLVALICVFILLAYPLVMYLLKFRYVVSSPSDFSLKKMVIPLSAFLTVFLALNFPVNYAFEVPPTNLLVVTCIFLIMNGLSRTSPAATFGNRYWPFIWRWPTRRQLFGR